MTEKETPEERKKRILKEIKEAKEKGELIVICDDPMCSLELMEMADDD